MQLWEEQMTSKSVQRLSVKSCLVWTVCCGRKAPAAPVAPKHGCLWGVCQDFSFHLFANIRENFEFDYLYPKQLFSNSMLKWDTPKSLNLLFISVHFIWWKHADWFHIGIRTNWCCSARFLRVKHIHTVIIYHYNPSVWLKHLNKTVKPSRVCELSLSHEKHEIQTNGHLILSAMQWNIRIPHTA